MRWISCMALVAACRESPKPRNELPADELRPLAVVDARAAVLADARAAVLADARAAVLADAAAQGTWDCPDPPIKPVPKGAPRVLAVYAESSFWPADADDRARERLFENVSQRVAAKEHARLLSRADIDAARAKAGDELVCTTPRWTRALAEQYPNLVTASLGTECRTQEWCAIAVTVEDHTRHGKARWHGYTQSYDRTVDETSKMIEAANRLEPMGVLPPWTLQAPQTETPTP